MSNGILALIFDVMPVEEVQYESHGEVEFLGSENEFCPEAYFLVTL